MRRFWLHSVVIMLIGSFAAAGVDAKPVQKTRETKKAIKAMKKWKGLAERDCETKFDVWFDLAPYAKYEYAKGTSRKKLLGTGGLGLFGGNFFTEMSSACRTFGGNKPTTCVPVLQKFKKIVFRGHDNLDAKNTDVDLQGEGDTLTVVYPPSIQWQTELMAKTLYEKFDCEGNEERVDPSQAKAVAPAAPKLVQDSSELRDSIQEMKRWKEMAEADCETKFDVWFDVGPYDKYAYAEDWPRKRMLGTGGLGLHATNFFNEMRGACRTFSGNKPTTCVPVLQKFKKLVFRGHDNLDAKNVDVDLVAKGDTLTVVFPPSIQWQTELMAKTLYEKFDCDGSEER